MNLDYFPLGLATGERFCNRTQERERLANNIALCKQTVLISPRRYGKSSLANRVIEDLKLPYVAIDLFVTYDDKLVCDRLVKGVSELVAKMTPFTTKALGMVEECFKNARAVLSAGHVELEITFSRPTFDPVIEIYEILVGLDKLAVKQNMKVVILIDEFQNIIFTQNATAIQGAIRSVAQATKNIAFIFSGSSRNMLSHMFDDSSQPLYMLCQKIFLDRITADHYLDYIQDAAKKKWKKQIDLTVIERILQLTECHSFYVNLLCSDIWAGSELPNCSDVENAWLRCLNNESRRIEACLSPLSANQLNVLRTIASTPNLKEPTSVAFLQKANLSVGSIQRTLSYLYENDFIYKTDSGVIELIDPLIKTRLQNLSAYHY